MEFVDPACQRLDLALKSRDVPIHGIGQPLFNLNETAFVCLLSVVDLLAQPRDSLFEGTQAVTPCKLIFVQAIDLAC